MTRVVIPAAGLGQRLRPHTDHRPKCLVPVGGVPILERLLTRLHRAGVADVVCVVGYRGDMVVDFVDSLACRPPVTFVHNRQYETTNSIVSLHASLDHWDGDVAIVDSDVVVAQRLLDVLLDGTGDAMVVDRERSRCEIDMAVEVRDGAVWHLDKDLPPERTYGEFFGLSRWSADGAARLRATIEEMVDAGDTGVWYQFAIRRLAKRMPIRPLDAHRDEWTEVDSVADLAAADAACASGAPWGRP